MVLPVPWVLLAALAIALGWVTATPAFYWLGYFMLAVWLIGAVSTRLARRSLVAVRRLSGDQVEHSGQIGVEVTVTNLGLLPVPWLVAAESLPAGLPITGLRGRVGPLGGRRSFSFRYSLHAARRGYYHLGPTVLRTGDIFGLSRRDTNAAGVDAITVFPRIVPISHGRFASFRPAGDVRVRHRAIEDPTQVVGIRPYQHGDGLKRVHWRATAHTGRLQSKLLEVSAQVETVLVVNLRRADYPQNPGDAAEAAELAVTTAASIADHVLARRQRVALVVLARDPAAPDADAVLRVKPGRNREQLTAMLSALGRAELGVGSDLMPVLEREKEQWAWGALIVLITPTLSGEPLRSAVNLRSSGFDVKAVLVSRGADELAGLEALGIVTMSVQTETDINGLAI